MNQDPRIVAASTLLTLLPPYPELFLYVASFHPYPVLRPNLRAVLDVSDPTFSKALSVLLATKLVHRSPGTPVSFALSTTGIDLRTRILELWTPTQASSAMMIGPSLASSSRSPTRAT